MSLWLVRTSFQKQLKCHAESIFSSAHKIQQGFLYTEEFKEVRLSTRDSRKTAILGLQYFALLGSIPMNMPPPIEKLLLLLAAFALSPFTLLYVYQHLRSTFIKDESVFQKGDCAVVPSLLLESQSGTSDSMMSRRVQSSCPAHPMCMKEWMMAGQEEVRKNLKERQYLTLRASDAQQKTLHNNASPAPHFINLDGNGNTSSDFDRRHHQNVPTTTTLSPHPNHRDFFIRSSVIIGSDEKLLRYMHHIPHFSEVYFNFFSAALWTCSLHHLDLPTDKVLICSSSNLTLTKPNFLRCCFIIYIVFGQ